MPAVRDLFYSAQYAMQRALYAYEDAIFNPEDDQRAAQLGSLAELPSLGEALAAWRQRIEEDQPVDYETPIRDLNMLADGRLSNGSGRLSMTYRAFGTLLRQWTNPPRNVARVLKELSVLEGGWEKDKHSPRACAYNAYLRRYKGNDSIMLRTRMLGDRRVIIGTVSQRHSLEGGDDRALAMALSLAFTGHMREAKASAYRGIEVSEIRVILPTLQVDLPGTGTELWAGYITARNSEVGAAGWNVSAGLYRRSDGVSVACEAVVRGGRHSGKKVAGKMVDVAESAADMLKDLMLRASQLANIEAPWNGHETLRRLAAACKGTPAGSEENLCAMAFAMGLNGAPTVGRLIDMLGRITAKAEHRSEALALEILMGRLLVRGWGAFTAVGEESEDV